MLTEEQKESIKKDYNGGLTYREIQAKYNICSARATSILKGMRSLSEATNLSLKRGRRNLTENGRLRLSEAGKKSIRSGKKIWTKPEKEFVNILRLNNIGVQFPEYMCEIFNVISDNNASIYAQYPIQRYVCDFVHLKTKTIFRINGDFWHANPMLYSNDKLTKIQKFNCIRDKLAKTYFEKKGWYVVDIWESEIYWNRQIVLEKIGRIAQQAGATDLHSEGSPFKSEYDHQINDWSDRLKDLWFKKPKIRKKRILFEKTCICGRKYNTKDKNQKFCCYKCRTKRPSKEELLQFVDNFSITQIAKRYNVTGKSIRKWLHFYNIKWIRKLCESSLKNLEEYRIKEMQESEIKHRCKCGGHISDLRHKRCRKCFINGINN